MEADTGNPPVATLVPQAATLVPQADTGGNPQAATLVPRASDNMGRRAAVMGGHQVVLWADHQRRADHPLP